MPKLPYTQTDRDLCRLASERVIDTLHSVVQLADNKGQAFMVAVSAHGAIAGAMAGAYDAWQGNERASDPIEVAIALLEASRSSKGEAE